MLSTQPPLVSIIMNCYNGEKYLRETIDSVLAQTYPNWEIIFWDNQSVDRSADIVKSYGDARIRYFYAPEHTTLGRARNLAAEQAVGEWLAFLDCDDLWSPDKLEKQVGIIREEGEGLGLVYGQCRYLVEKGAENTRLGNVTESRQQGQALENLPEGDIFSDLLKANFVTLVSAMVRRSAYWAVGGIDPLLKQSEDYDLFLKTSTGFKARAVQEVVCSYRIHDSNLTHTQAWNNYQENIAIISRYLPLKAARNGVLINQTYLSSVEMRQGRLFQGIVRLLIHGNVLLFLGRTARFILRRLPVSRIS